MAFIFLCMQYDVASNDLAPARLAREGGEESSNKLREYIDTADTRSTYVQRVPSSIPSVCADAIINLE